MPDCTCGGVDIGVGVMHEPGCELRADGRVECECGYRIRAPLEAPGKSVVCQVCGAAYEGHADGTSGGAWVQTRDGKCAACSGLGLVDGAACPRCGGRGR